MKRILFLIALFLTAPFATAQAPSYTPNFGFQIPAYGTSNWQVPLDYNFNLLDQILNGSIPAGGISTWTSTVTYQVGQLILYNGQGFVSLQNGNTGNAPAIPSVWWTNNLAPVAAQTVSGGMTANTIPKASGASSLVNSVITDTGHIVTFNPSSGGGVQVNGYLNVTQNTTLGNLSATNAVFSNGLVSGVWALGNLQNNTPAQPIQFTQAGGGLIGAYFVTGVQLGQGLALGSSASNFGTSGNCLISQGGTPIFGVVPAPIWGSCGSGGGTVTLPASGIPFMTSTTTGTAATSPQLVTALNATPSTTLAAALIPTLNQNTTGIAALATLANNLTGTPTLPNGTAATTQGSTDNTTKLATTAFVQTAVAAVGGSSPIFTHTLSGATPTAVVNSATIPAFDTENVTLSTNVTSMPLPAVGVIADGEVMTFLIAQPSAGSAFTIAAGQANSPLTAGSGTTVQNTVPGGCPNIGTSTGTNPSQLLLSVGYKASVAQYQILGCQSLPAQTAVVEATMPGGIGNYGQYGAPTFLMGTSMVNAGHFTNIQVTNVSPTSCTTGPTINLENLTQGTFGAAGVVGPNTGSASGNVQNGAQTLSFNAGDSVALYVSVTGVSCFNNFAVTAQYVEP